jgi:nicotinamide-nucleotide adenylyltransferase
MEREKKVALFVGRFQPFHLGHMHAIEEILRKNSKALIVIGSSEDKFTARNPFTYKERREMMKKALLPKFAGRIEIGHLKDFNNDGLWADALKGSFSFDRAYSRNPWTTSCLEKAGFRVYRQRLFNESRFSGSEIRRRMAQGRDWSGLVPAGVYDYIKNMEGEKRVRRLLKGK